MKYLEILSWESKLSILPAAGAPEAAPGCSWIVSSPDSLERLMMWFW